MKTINSTVSKTLLEVWKCKDEVYRDIKDKNFEEKGEYFKKGLDEALKILKGKLKKNPDGSYTIIPIKP